MDFYAVKKVNFLGKPVTYICQNINGPCPLLAICNVLLLRGHIQIEEYISEGQVSSENLIQVIMNRLIQTNPPFPANEELARLTQEKTLQDVVDLLPSLLVGLDVNVRFHSITDFEYTVPIAVFDMLDISLVHGWLLDIQDEETFKVIENKSYNQLIEQLVDYREVLQSEHAQQQAQHAQQQDEENEFRGFVFKRKSSMTSPPASPTNRPSFSSAKSSNEKKSPSKHTVEQMMKERQLSDTDATTKATQLLEEGPLLEAFFHSTASQLTYYGLVKLHEDLRERQLCVFFRNNHFSTIFKWQGHLYLLVTDAGYYDEPSVVWERLNEIDGDSEYFDAELKPLNTELTQQQKILQEQEQLKAKTQIEAQAQGLQAQMIEKDSVEDTPSEFIMENVIQKKGIAPSSASPKASPKAIAAGSNAAIGFNGKNEEEEEEEEQEEEEDVEEKEEQAATTKADEDYLLALKLQQEEEEFAKAQAQAAVAAPGTRGTRGTTGVPNNTTLLSTNSPSTGRRITTTTRRRRSIPPTEQYDKDNDYNEDEREEEEIRFSATGQPVLSPEEIREQREAELYYRRLKQQQQQQPVQYQQSYRRPPPPQQQQQQEEEEESDCTIM